MNSKQVPSKWNTEYLGRRKNINTGKMEDVYNCTCSVCGWKTGNQGIRFMYCPMCGTKMVSDSKGEFA